MQLQSLIENLGLTLVSGDGGQELSDLTDDSRGVKPGGLFVARSSGGADDERWRTYAEDAIRRGASAVIAPAVLDVPAGVSLVVLRDAATRIDQPFVGRLAACFFGEPAKRLKLVGITGTNGKTTVATLTQYLLNAAGVKCGLLGTVAIDDGSPDGPVNAELTTPGAIDLHRYFAAMVANGCEACAMEVSSHALDQGRVDGLEFAVAVFTNLTQDHLDYHGTMENYAAAKAKLFALLKPDGIVVVNADSSALIEITPSDIQHIRWTTIDLNGLPSASVSDRETSYVIAGEIWALESSESTFGISGLTGVADASMFSMSLPGRHNVSNMLQAITAIQMIWPMAMDELTEAVADCTGVPGRLEVVEAQSGDAPSILVDYAHTPDALTNVLNALRPLLIRGGRLICVFGCGGDRDRTKRPLMTQAACGLADVAMLTSDNPRTEDPQQILDDAIAGVPPEAKSKLVVEIDRARAIESAILNAGVHDTVLIAGKGHEDYQILGTEKIHFDDREYAAAALKKWVAQHPDGEAGGGT
ncbi:MAG: UDP-N-acetylmuramoyl-L-alanyl-D-glutamate--2,6-diaminopimelate ligase [Planctomycetota bacterium]